MERAFLRSLERPPPPSPGFAVAALGRIIRGEAAEESLIWFDRTVATLAEAPFDRPSFLIAYAAAGRRLTGAPRRLAVEDEIGLRELGVETPAVWSLADLARTAMLLGTLSRLAPERHGALATEIFRKGDSSERQALLRALALLPEPSRFAALGLEACRTSVQSVFEAIACENGYPAGHFPELGFNQMVLKALFTGVALARIVGLERRRNPELARMARDYASERRAAGRSVPQDIALVLDESPP